MNEKFSRPFKMRPDSRKDEAGRLREVKGLNEAKRRAQQVPAEQFPEDIPYPKRETSVVDKAAIKMMNEVIQEERKGAGITDDWYITPDRFTFYSAPFATGYMMPASANNLFDRIKVIEYQKGIENGAHYVFMLHEMVHLGAYSVVVGVNGAIKVRKMGFHLHNLDLVEGEDIPGMVFLDEAVVQSLTTEILQAKRDQFEDELHLSTKDMESLIDLSKNKAYAFPTFILGKVIKGIARHNKIPVEDVWKQCKTSYFNSDLAFFRDIERVFGAGTLRLLDSLDSTLLQTPANKETITMLKEYFSPDTNHIKRFNIALQLLEKIPSKPSKKT